MSEIKKYISIFELNEESNIKLGFKIRDNLEEIWLVEMLDKLNVTYSLVMNESDRSYMLTIPCTNYHEVNNALRRYQLDPYLIGKMDEQVKWKTEKGKKVPYSDNPDMDVVKEDDDYVEKPKEEGCAKNKKEDKYTKYESIYSK